MAIIDENKSGRLARFTESHGKDQKEYLEWKAEILKNIAGKAGIKNYTCYNKQVDKYYDTYNFYTISIGEILDFHKIFYKDDIKIIDKKTVQDFLTPFSLAVWLMDDGFIDKVSQRIYFCTECFTFEEHQILQNILKEKFDLNVKIIKYGKYHRLHFTVLETRKLCEIVRPHVVENMKYKLTKCCASADNIQHFSQI